MKEVKILDYSVRSSIVRIEDRGYGVALKYFLYLPAKHGYLHPDFVFNDEVKALGVSLTRDWGYREVDGWVYRFEEVTSGLWTDAYKQAEQALDKVISNLREAMENREQALSHAELKKYNVSDGSVIEWAVVQYPPLDNEPEPAIQGSFFRHAIVEARLPVDIPDSLQVGLSLADEVITPNWGEVKGDYRYARRYGWTTLTPELEALNSSLDTRNFSKYVTNGLDIKYNIIECTPTHPRRDVILEVRLPVDRYGKLAKYLRSEELTLAGAALTMDWGKLGQKECYRYCRQKFAGSNCADARAEAEESLSKEIEAIESAILPGYMYYLRKPIKYIITCDGELIEGDNALIQEEKHDG